MLNQLVISSDELIHHDMNIQISPFGNIQRSLVRVGRESSGRPQLSKALDFALFGGGDSQQPDRRRPSAVPGHRPAPLQPAAVLRDLVRQQQRRLDLHGTVGTVLVGGGGGGGGDAAGRAEEAGEREPKRSQAHEEGRLPRERRVQQGHSIGCVVYDSVPE